MDKDAFRLLRKQYKLTQEAMGKALGYSRFAINAWETGKSNIPADIMQKLAAANLLVPAQKEPTKAEIARKEGEAKLIEHYVAIYRRLRAWPDIPNHNAAMKRFALEGTVIPPEAYPLILAEWPDILSDPDGNYTVSKEQSRATILGVDKA